jgi:hypothetical protein
MASWNCSLCGTDNGPNDPECATCGATRSSGPAPESVAASGGPKGSAQDLTAPIGGPTGTAVVAAVASGGHQAGGSAAPSSPTGSASPLRAPAHKVNGVLVGALGAVALVATIGVLLLGGSSNDKGSATGTSILVPQTTASVPQATASVPQATASSAPQVTTSPPTASPATQPPATAPTPAPVAAVTAEQQSWPNDPTRCGPNPTDTGQAYNSSLSYQVTASIHLWSSTSTSSTPLTMIPVTQFGTGGAGCPTPSDPVVTVTCKTTGDAITGPFSTDSTWEQVRWNGTTGYVPDEWINTQWDSASGGIIPNC